MCLKLQMCWAIYYFIWVGFTHPHKMYNEKRNQQWTEKWYNILFGDSHFYMYQKPEWSVETILGKQYRENGFFLGAFNPWKASAHCLVTLLT